MTTRQTDKDECFHKTLLFHTKIGNVGRFEGEWGAGDVQTSHEFSWLLYICKDPGVLAVLSFLCIPFSFYPDSENEKFQDFSSVVI